METPHRVAVAVGDKAIRLDMPELLGGTHKGVMPLEALLAAYAGSLNVTGNFVAHTTDFDLRHWQFTVWAELIPAEFGAWPGWASRSTWCTWKRKSRHRNPSAG